MACDQRRAEHLGLVVAISPGEAARAFLPAEQRPDEAICEPRVLTGGELALPGPVAELVRAARPEVRPIAAARRRAGSRRRCRGLSRRRACGCGWNKGRSSWVAPAAATIAPDTESVETESAAALAAGRPALFQLRFHFVLAERIGIAEIGAEQVLTNRSHANEPAIAAFARFTVHEDETVRNISRTAKAALSRTDTEGTPCSASDSISFAKNESESKNRRAAFANDR